MKRIGVYLFKDLDQSDLDLVLNKYSSQGQVHFYSNKDYLNVNFTEEKSENEYEDANQMIRNLSKEFYSRFKNTPLKNSKFNFWAHLRFISFLEIVNFLRIENWIKKLSKEFTLDEFVFVNLDPKIQNLVQFHYPKSIFISPSSKNKSSESKKIELVKNVFQIIFYGIKSFFFKSKTSKNTLLISKEVNYSNLLSKNGIIQEDKYLYHITEKLNENEFDRILDTKIYSKKHILNYKSNSVSGDFNFCSEQLFVSLFFKLNFYSEAFKTFNFLKKIDKKNSLLDVLILNNKKGLFAELTSYWMFFYFLKKRKYKNVVLSDEMSPGTNSIVRAAKNLNINTIGIQHGVVNENNIGYNYSDEELSIDDSFPNKIIVWGEIENHFLRKNKVLQNNRIKKFGNVVLDGCRYLNEGKVNSKFTILFATQPQPIVELRTKSLEDFVNAVLKFSVEEVEVIIRLHPKEYKDYSMYSSLLKKVDKYDIEIDKGEELFTQINKSNVVVTSYSTVSKDALILKKAIILMDYQNNDITGLLKENLALNAINENDMFLALKNIKDDNLAVNEKEYQRVISKTFASTKFNVAEKIIKELVQ